MPEKETLERAEQDKREGKSPSTQAGEFVREEIEHVREGKHGARSTKQAIAIGLSKARRAGVDLDPPKKGSKKYLARKVIVNASYGWLESAGLSCSSVVLTGTSLTFSVERRVKKRFAMPNSISLVSAIAST